MKTLLILFLAFSSSLTLAQNENLTSDVLDRPRSDSGMFIEPMLLYNRQDARIRTSQLMGVSGDTSAQSQGGGIGMRIGGHMAEIFVAGADLRYVRDEISDSFYGRADVDSYNVGPTIGVQTPLAGMRLWGTYVVAGEYDPSKGNVGLDIRFRQAYGPRIGAGFHFGPVALNLEYQKLKYRNTKIESLGNMTIDGNVDVDFEIEGLTAGLSFPMEL